MTTKSQRTKGRDSALSSLNMALDALNRAEGATVITPAKAAFTSAGVLLTTIRDSMVSKVDYVELGLTCAGVCETLNRGIDKRRADQLSQSVLEAIEQLTAAVDEIQRHIIKWGKRNPISRLNHAKDDKKAIATWRLDFERILPVLSTGLGMNTHATVSGTHQDTANEHTVVSGVHLDGSNAEVNVSDAHHNVSNTHPIISDVRSDIANTHTVTSDIRRDKMKSREDVKSKNQTTHARAPGESPPPLPRNTHGTTSDIRRDVISEVRRDVANTQTMVSDIHRMLKSQPQLTQKSVPGELPPPSPRIFFGRDELIEKIVGFAEHLAPIALIGAGGIGKTSIILTVLHHDRIKQRYGNSRWFIRCDQFPASHTHFLRRLSEVIGAGIENPTDLAPLRRYLSSKEMMIVLDNAESILDPQGTSVQETSAIVDELTRFSNVCLCITSRISTVPPGCETLEIPTLSIEAARDTFYQIYKHGGHSDPINDVLGQLDFHPLSITLLATVAQYSKWDTKRLIREWEGQRTGVLHTHHSGSIAATIELSLASPMFRDLGPDARGLLGVIAFFPQGVNEENIGWLFPTISDGPHMFDTFCVLSLTYRSNGFVTMLAPLRDYLRPKDPTSSPLLTTTKERYFSRLPAGLKPDTPGFQESRWITSEDVNTEHLLDVFTSIDANSESVWHACTGFIEHLHWHKPRLVTLGAKIEALPDGHPSKAQCLHALSHSFGSVGHRVESKRLLIHSLRLWRERGDDYQVAHALCCLSVINAQVGLPKEGIQEAKESSEIFGRIGDTRNQARSLIRLAASLHDNDQLNAAAEAASRAINLLPEKGEEAHVCEGHHTLGVIYRSMGNTEEAIHHLEVALEIASSLNLRQLLFQVHTSLGRLFAQKGEFDHAHPHMEQAKSYVANHPHSLAYVSLLQAGFWAVQRMHEEAKSAASGALEVFEKLGAGYDAEHSRQLLRRIDREVREGLGPGFRGIR